MLDVNAHYEDTRHRSYLFTSTRIFPFKQEEWRKPPKFKAFRVFQMSLQMHTQAFWTDFIKYLQEIHFFFQFSIFWYLFMIHALEDN